MSADKYLFYHVPRTAGKYCLQQLADKALILNPWGEGKGRDHSFEELCLILDNEIWPHRRVVVHNHSYAWNPELAKQFQAAGWKIFTFYRPEGEIIKSLINAFGGDAATLRNFRWWAPHPDIKPDFIAPYGTEGVQRLLTWMGAE